MRGQRFGVLVAGLAVLLVAEARAANFYVASEAGSGGDGSATRPWALGYALSHPPAVHPGDTIWLRGGTYRGTFTSYLSGTSVAPIIVRQYPGERAIVDGGDSGARAILSITGAYTWYWGFEVMSSNPVRVASTDGDSPPEIVRGEGIAIVQSSSTGSGLKFINLVIHDALQGIAFWKEAVDAEIYGCLIYNNGWDAPSRGSGHGVYAQNQTGTKKITDNVIFSGYGYGIHAYGSSVSFLDNFLVQGNTLFNSGNLSAAGPSRVLLVGGGSVAHNPRVSGNFMYRSASGGPSQDFDMGYDAGCASPVVTNNYVATTTYFVNCTSGLTMTGNIFYGPARVPKFAFPSNTYLSSRPGGVQVFVRPNQYEPGRGNVTVYNWALQSTVSVDLSGVLTPGTAFEVRDAQNFSGPPVLIGTYAGGPVSLPMTGLTPTAPVGAPAHSPSGPEFNAFVVLTKVDASGIHRVATSPPNPPPPIRRTPRPN